MMSEEYGAGYEDGMDAANDSADAYIEKLEAMYAADTMALRKRVLKLENERDEWKLRALGAEQKGISRPDSSTATSDQIRHV